MSDTQDPINHLFGNSEHDHNEEDDEGFDTLEDLMNHRFGAFYKMIEEKPDIYIQRFYTRDIPFQGPLGVAGIYFDIALNKVDMAMELLCKTGPFLLERTWNPISQTAPEKYTIYMEFGVF